MTEIFSRHSHSIEQPRASYSFSVLKAENWTDRMPNILREEGKSHIGASNAWEPFTPLDATKWFEARTIIAHVHGHKFDNSWNSIMHILNFLRVQVLFAFTIVTINIA